MKDGKEDKEMLKLILFCSLLEEYSSLDVTSNNSIDVLLSNISFSIIISI